jgi:hypothetical protein
LSYHYLD